MTTNIEETLIQRMRTLPVERQVEVLDFVDFLSRKSAVHKPRRDPIGIFAGLDIDINAEEIDAARAELWVGFDVGDSDDFDRETQNTVASKELMGVLARRKARSSGRYLSAEEARRKLGLDGGQ